MSHESTLKIEESENIYFLNRYNHSYVYQIPKKMLFSSLYSGHFDRELARFNLELDAQKGDSKPSVSFSFLFVYYAVLKGIKLT